MKPGIIPRLVILMVFTTLVSVFANGRRETEWRQKSTEDNRCDSFPLPNPSEIGVKKFEKLLYAFLENRCYKNWVC